ncbi:MAG: FAD-dependent oxidoreductase [Betaproteobacteria bacterium]
MAILPSESAHPEVSTQVVVIGAGACGLTAALAARERGAEVLVLERDTRPTGSTSLSTGLIPAACTRLQEAAGIQDSAELLASDILKKARHQTDAAIVLAVAQASGPTVDWLMQTHQLQFTLVQGYLYPGHSVLRMHGTPQRTGTELEAGLLAAAERMGVDIVCSARATDLHATAQGKVTAVRFERPNGTIETLGCEALVLGCSGFGGNAELLRQHIPEIAGAEFWGHKGNQGDALRWGLDLGAAVADLGSYQGHGGVSTPYGNPINWGVLTEGGFMVNALGQRFSNEVHGYSEQAIETLAQPGGFAWDVFDARREEPVLGFTDYRQVMALGGVRSADSLAELARRMQVPVGALEATFSEVAALCSSGLPDRFGRSFAGKQPLSPPYRAIKITGALFHTQGGLVIDTSARVLRPDAQPLPNLFAGGGAARGMSGPSRWGYFSGGGLLTAIALGRLAGNHAARVVCAQAPAN